jgi:hypothetical protein
MPLKAAFFSKQAFFRSLSSRAAMGCIDEGFNP